MLMFADLRAYYSTLKIVAEFGIFGAVALYAIIREAIAAFLEKKCKPAKQ